MIVRWLSCCVGFVLYVVFAITVFAAGRADSSFDFSSVPFSQVVNLYFREVSVKPYMVCNDVLSDQRHVSLRASGKLLDAAVFGALLDAYGYEAREEGGVTVVCKRLDVGRVADLETFIYRPVHRDASYLVDFLSSLVRGTFANKRAPGAALTVGGGDPGSAPAKPAQSSAYRPAGDDYLIFSGQLAEVERLKKLLAQVDVPSGEVVVKAHVYEVGLNETDSAALEVFASVLGGKLSLTSAVVGAIGNALRLNTSSIDVVASLLKADGRFKLVTSPFARVRSGATARFVVGSDVPVLGSIVTSQNGQTQQSVEYRSSGTIFEVSPVVRAASTDLDLFQQVSTFVSTETGVNSSPTLNKRELRTSLTVGDGEVLVIGGLNEKKEDEVRNSLPFLPFPLSRSNGVRSSELLLVLELQRL